MTEISLASRRGSAMLSLVVLSGIATGADIGPAPAFDRAPVVDTFHGVKVADPYRALEDGTDPKVIAWTEAQNERTLAYLRSLPYRKTISERLDRLTRASSPYFYRLQAEGQKIFALYNDASHQQPLLVTLNASADPSSLVELVNPNSLHRDGRTRIDWYVASPDGTKVAASLSRNGTEAGTLHVYEVASGREIEQPIPNVQNATAHGDVCWTEDSKAFWYTRYPEPKKAESERYFNQTVYYHVLGTPAHRDPQVLSADQGMPRLAEVFFDRSGGGAALASVQLGDSGRWQHFILRPGVPAQRIAKYEDEIVAASIAPDGTVFGVSRLNAPMGRVLKLTAPYPGTGFATAKTIIGEEQDAAISFYAFGVTNGSPLAVAGGRLFVKRILGGPNTLMSYRLDGTDAKVVAVPDQAAVGELVPLPSGDLIYSVSTYLDPTYFARARAADGVTIRTPLTQKSSISFADIEVTRVFATSQDGTRIPLSIIAKKGVARDGRSPTLLFGYGGLGIPVSPRLLSAFHRLWLDAGGVYAVANIRGGGEYGENWHRDGSLTRKQNVFDDFAAAANTLIERGYTNAERLALMGQSNGGLLMGAMITQHPELARAVVSSIGVYDSLRLEREPNGAFNTGEFGTVAKPDEFRALYAYSPYHRVRTGTRYPAVLLLAGANDRRVDPWQSRKFAAALQAAQSADAPILLHTSKTAGHGATAVADRVSDDASRLLFLFDQLRINPVIAQERPTLAGFYLTHSVAFDDPRWRIEDLACRGYCLLGQFKHLQALLSDPKNADRSVKELLHDAEVFSKKERESLVTAAARQQTKLYADPANDPVIEECKPDHDGWKHQVLAPLPMQIDQYDDRVELRYEYWNAVRTVYTDGRGFEPNVPPSRLGQSIGRYEGKTLVVETSGILPNVFRLSGVGAFKHSDKARAVERYTLGEDGQRLDLEWSFIDPENLVRPVQGQKSWLYSKDGTLEEFSCDAITGQY